jgi:hypothetical protein
MSSQISERARNELQLETLSLMVHLPLYLKLDDDYVGSVRILTILSELYGFNLEFPEVEMAAKQYEQVNPAMNENPALREMVKRFERDSDSESEPDSTGENPTISGGEQSDAISLSPEIEQFLSDIAHGETDPDNEDPGLRSS